MKTERVRDIMVPLVEYATVNEDESLYDAVLALEEANRKFKDRLYKHRGILVKNKKGEVIGKISERDILQGLEPKYADIIEDERGLSYHGYTASFIKSIMQTHKLLEKPLEDLCGKAAKYKVADVMYVPSVGEYVTADATLDEAVHQLVIGHHQSLLVTSDGKVVGILRLSDVFHIVCEKIKMCPR